MKAFRKLVLLFSIIGVINGIWFLMDDTWNRLIPQIAAVFLMPTVGALNLIEILISEAENKRVDSTAVISRSICLLLYLVAVFMFINETK